MSAPSDVYYRQGRIVQPCNTPEGASHARKITVSQQETFSTPPLVMSVGPKLKFGSDHQDITRNGERKWSCQAACQLLQRLRHEARAEVIEVGLVGEALDVQPVCRSSSIGSAAGSPFPRTPIRAVSAAAGPLVGGWRRPLAVPATGTRPWLVPSSDSGVPSGVAGRVPDRPGRPGGRDDTYSALSTLAFGPGRVRSTLTCCRWRSTG